ncbi:hypothetical protein ETT61_02715 [Streptococcus pyogenes]|nr:hypothetical protein ETT61_02715 [Streptococcus pyogenes]
MMMLRDVKVKTSSLLVGCAATLLVSLSSTVAAEAKREINFHPSDQQVTAKVKESSDFHQKQHQTGITYGDDTLADLTHHLLHSDGVLPSLNDKSA